MKRGHSEGGKSQVRVGVTEQGSSHLGVPRSGGRERKQIPGL